MTRGFVTLLLIMVVGLEGPALAYATAASPAGSALTAPADCLAHLPAKASGDSACCWPGALASACCAGSIVFATILSTQMSSPALSLALVPHAGGSVAFATESPGPELRPPIV